MASPDSAPSPLLGSRSRAPPQETMATRSWPIAPRPAARQALDAPDVLMCQQEHSPAYQALHESKLINATYRKMNDSELDLIRSNSTMARNWRLRTTSYVAGCVIGGCIYDWYVRQFSVRQGHLRRGSHSGGDYLLFGPGVHRIPSPFVTVQTDDIPISQPHITHGTQTIVTVPQGFVGFATDRGQPVLLPPGLHQWISATMNFERLIDLSSPVIHLGPFTLVTVDQGYSAITQDNGEQKVLPGGQTHMLTHRNWKFEKFISEKIQTNDLGPIRATSGDNVPLDTVATVTWRIEKPALAARMAANTMGAAGENATTQAQREDISKLRQDVLKQSTASLAAFIGSIRYSDGLHVSAKIARSSTPSSPITDLEPVAEQPRGNAERRLGATAIFDAESVGCAVTHANAICQKFGVEIISINVISACPSDQRLIEALSAGAVAAAEAEQAETAARGNARAALISAQSDAEARRIRARGASDAAKELHAAGDVAVEIARLEKAGEAFGGSTNLFVAEGPSALPAAILAGSACFSKGTASKSISDAS